MKKILILFLAMMSLTVQAQELTHKEKRDVLDSVILKLKNIYPFSEVSDRVIDGLKIQIYNGEFNEFNTPDEFAAHVTKSMEDLSNDKHLDLLYDPNLAKALLSENIPAISYTDEEAKIEVWNNYGFKELSILDGNVGYLNLTVFFAIGYAGKSADIAMSFFSNCNALIIDLRQNGGGWGDMVDYLLGYFYSDISPFLINITKSTVDGSIFPSTVPGYVPNKKLVDIPIYVLTSSLTASAAESFTSHIKYLNENVTIVGNKTKGAENPVSHFALNENFVLQIPSMIKTYSANPYVWEGVGINPDVEVGIKDAKIISYKMALERLISETNVEFALNKYQWALDGLKASYNVGIDTANFKRIAGDYNERKILLKDGKLFYKHKDKAARLLTPITDTYFIVDGLEYLRIRFILEETVIMKQIYSYGIEREFTKNK